MTLPFPGLKCRYYAQGVCLREEIHNPGYRTDYACFQETKQVKEWEAFLDRAEVFRLSEDDAARIWAGRNKAPVAAQACPYQDKNIAFEKGEGCSFWFQGACLNRMPRCPGGRCSFFEVAQE